MGRSKVYQFLDANEIEYKTIEHPPVYTVAEAERYREGMEDATHAKNLFLKDKKRGNYYLFTAEAHSDMRLNELRKFLGAKHLSFASSDELLQYLGLEPGAVSPFGLLNDTDNIVTFVVEPLVWRAEFVAFHPNVNYQTLLLTGEEFRRVINQMGYSPIVVSEE